MEENSRRPTNPVSVSSERRHKLRFPAETKVILSHPALSQSRCATRDLSDGGAFVVTTEADRLPRGTNLGVTFVVQLNNVAKLHHFAAYVAQVHDDGLGLILESRAPG